MLFYQWKVSIQTPLQRILRSMVIWSVWAAVIGNFLVAQFTISYSPLYLTYVLGFPTMTAGFITIAPLAAQVSERHKGVLFVRSWSYFLFHLGM